MKPLKTRLIITFIFIACGLSTAAVENKDALKLAEDVGRWIASTAMVMDSGIAWPDDALHSDKISFDLASGVSGKVVYFIALYKATGKKQYLDFATKGADYLVSLLNSIDKIEGKRKTSLYSGISGIGVALMHINTEVPKLKYQKGLEKIIVQLESWSVLKDNKRHWSEQFNDLIFGDAGTILFLAHYGKAYDHKIAKEMSGQGGHFLISQSIKSKEGNYWLFRRDKKFNLPNFSHGTAGVSYVLATVGELLEDKALIKGAESGFKYLRSIAEINNKRVRIPYGWGADSWAGLYDYGWAHGLSGVAAFLKRMQQTNIDKDYATKYLSMVKSSLLESNLPNLPAKPFREPSTTLDMRFGRASILSLLSYWSIQDNNQAITNMRDAIYSHIITTGKRSEDSIHWIVDVPEFMGGGKAAYTGIFHGAAGIGMAFLNMHSSQSGETRYMSLPDDPFN
jgi:lantibiotic modifying enzyme